MKRQLAAGLLLAALVFALAPGASAQCAMCANAAETQKAEAQKALNVGIAALVAPVFLLVGGIVVLSYQRRNAPDEPSGSDSVLGERDPWHALAVDLPLDKPSNRPRPSA